MLAAGALVVAASVTTTVTVAAANGNRGPVGAVLRDATGAGRGTVRFTTRGSSTEVRVVLDGLPASVARDAFHGFHVHANDDAANGTGCVADPAAASSTWFVSADGHWRADGQVHASHHGDLPSVLVLADGRAEMRFTTGRIDRTSLVGRAVVLHAGPDNFGNVPVGAGANQYTPNSAAATTATQNTGNAGDRLLCGVVG